jgi:hypothetical protein
MGRSASHVPYVLPGELALVRMGISAATPWIPKAENVILLGPPGFAKTHRGIGLGIKAFHATYNPRLR